MAVLEVYLPGRYGKTGKAPGVQKYMFSFHIADISSDNTHNEWLQASGVSEIGSGRPMWIRVREWLRTLSGRCIEGGEARRQMDA